MTRKVIKKLDRQRGYFTFANSTVLKFCGDLSSFDINTAAMGDVFYNQDDGKIYVVAIEDGSKKLILLG